MTENVLPVILSLPHGGFGKPEELSGRLVISDTDIYNDCDLWIEQIFDFSQLTSAGQNAADVLIRVSTPIARSIIDVNRAADDLDNPDGPVKDRTAYGHATCVEPLSRQDKVALIEQYWSPYHSALTEAWSTYADDAALFLDCHNMAQTGPSAYGDPGASRPLICLANAGGANGEPLSELEPVSCAPSYIRQVAAIAGEVFSDLRLLEPVSGPPPPTVAINVPYNGGYILRRYIDERSQDSRLPPGLLIEFNRGLYVGNQSAHSEIAPPNEEHIAILRELTFRWLSRVVEELS